MKLTMLEMVLIAVVWILTYVAGAERSRRVAKEEALRASQDACMRLERDKKLLEELQQHERERFVQQLVSMRRAGFLPVETGGDEELGSWVLDDAHEAEVSASRRRETDGPLIQLDDPR
jgi:hypothetical protein